MRARRAQKRGTSARTRAEDGSGAAAATGGSPVGMGTDASSVASTSPTEPDEPTDSSISSNAASTSDGTMPEHNREDETLSRLLKLDSNPLWDVPWGMSTVVGVLISWFCGFVLVGQRIVPAVASVLGIRTAPGSASYLSCAVYTLITDVLELAVVLAVLRHALKEFQPLSRGWFPFRPSLCVLPDVVGACALFPVISSLCTVNEELCAASSSARHGFVAPNPWEQGVLTPDPLANMLYIVVFAVLAPLWEECIFRGFLLPSLTKQMPVDGSIAISSFVFALAHCKADQIMPLWLLGAVLGVVFIRSRNMLAPLAVHAAWNLLAFIEIV